MAKFNPTEHMSDIKGKEYLEVKWRIVWFRSEHPNGRIDTDVTMLGEMAICKSTVWNNDGVIIASGMATVRSDNRATWSGRDIEKAETAAIGRALAVAGYGTQFTGNEMDEDDYLSDSPVQKKQNKTTGNGSQPSNVTSLPPQSNASGNSDGLQYGKSTLQVFTKETAAKDKRYMTVSGVSIWTRKPFEALGYNEQVIEDLGELGEHVLPHAVTPVFVIDPKTKYKKLVQLRRDDTGEIVDADGNPVDMQAASNQ